jgi:acyl-CoA thioester hydrolase
MQRQQPAARRHFARFVAMTTRWLDNDTYGHLNNAVYYVFFDSAVNQILIEARVLDPMTSPIVGLVVESRCTYFRPLRFPDRIEVGLSVASLGRSSVRYHIAIFGPDSDLAAAQGDFTHVYVDRTSRKAVPIPEPVRVILTGLAV